MIGDTEKTRDERRQAHDDEGHDQCRSVALTVGGTPYMRCTLKLRHRGPHEAWIGRRLGHEWPKVKR